VRKVAYIAGPMRGYEDYNFPAFLDAAEKLRAKDYIVLSPAEHDLSNGFDPSKPIEGQGFDLKDALRWDLDAVLNSDVVVLLPGWAESKGANAEAAVALAAEIPLKSLEVALGEDVRA
jgi:hypothetical protein